jgi:hypothetical protein
VDEALRLRSKVALELVHAGQLDGAVALSLVIWPSDELEAWSREVGTRVRWTDAHKRRARELAEQGVLSWSEIAVVVCGSARFKATVATWLRQRPAA